ncbi:MAG: hypothetical protein ACI8W7_002523 [Gammaproteobacteria bacterium]
MAGRASGLAEAAEIRFSFLHKRARACGHFLTASEPQQRLLRVLERGSEHIPGHVRSYFADFQICRAHVEQFFASLFDDPVEVFMGNHIVHRAETKRFLGWILAAEETNFLGPFFAHRHGQKIGAAENRRAVVPDDSSSLRRQSHVSLQSDARIARQLLNLDDICDLNLLVANS